MPSSSIPQPDTDPETASLAPRFRQSPWTEITDEPVTLRDIAAAFGGYLATYRGPLNRAFMAFFVAAVLAAIVPLTTKYIIDNLFPSHNALLLYMTAGAILVVFLLRSVINALGHSLMIYISTHIVFDLRRRLFEHLQLMHLAFYEREQSGKLVSKLITDASAIQALIQSALPILSGNVFTVLVALALMTFLNPVMTAVAFIVLALYTAISFVFRTQLYRRAREVRERSSVVAGNVSEVISGIRVVKSFGMEDQEHRRFVRMMRENLDYEIDLGTTNALRINTLDFLTGVAMALVILLGGAAVMQGGMTTGDYVAFMGFVAMMFTPLKQISDLAIQAIQARTAVERLIRILEVQPKVVDSPRARLVERLEGHVELENVSFAYEGGPMVLHDLCLDVPPGEVVALVGPTGAGKSTLVHLLTRFYDPTEGRILIDGMDLRTLNLKSYRRRVGIVLQEPFLFSGTVFDNICYGKGRASYEEVEEAAAQANALEFINELANGMETQVGERGLLLSLGERQRIAIARALLKDPDLLILDEATSSLDAQSESLVREAFERLMSGRTVFIIAHRLSTIQNADTIVVLDEGRIVEKGTHKDLMEVGGVYASLYVTDGGLVDSGEPIEELLSSRPAGLTAPSAGQAARA